MDKNAEVVVLGWWAKHQHRIDFVRLLQRELRLGLAEAKGVLDSSLRDEAEFITIPLHAGRALTLMTEVQGMGAECRVVLGGDEAVATQRAHLRTQFGTLQRTSFSSADARTRVRTLAPEMSESVLRFVERAQAFCGFVEEGNDRSLSERLRQTATHLSLLYAAALELPDVEPGPTEEEPKVTVPEGWTRFGELEFYWEVFDPYEDKERVANCLSDDVLDIYADVKRGLLLWRPGEPTCVDAIWSWRFHFGCHWGDHAVDALRVLQRALQR